MASPNFFNFAREIRDEIYEYALVSPSNLQIFNTTPNPQSCCCDTHFVHNVGPTFYGVHQRETFKNQLPSDIRECDSKELPPRRACSLSLPQGTCTEYTEFRQWHPNAALLRACRQLNQEALPILYGKNRFCFDEHKLLILRESFSERALLPGPSFMSATAICFDWLKSLPEPTLHFIRKIEFNTNPFTWRHRRVFEFITKKTRVDDVELTFNTWNPWHHPWESDISILPWSPGIYDSADIVIQQDRMNIFSLCQLTGLRRLAITMVSGFKFWGPIVDDSRDGQLRIHANLIRLCRSKMLSQEVFQKASEPAFLATSMVSLQALDTGAINQTIDHIHCDVTEPRFISSFQSSSPSTVASINRDEEGRSSGHQFVYESICPVCGQTESMRYDKGRNREEIEGQQPLITTERNHASFQSWPQELDDKAFYKFVTTGGVVANGKMNF
jgi:hypothetical protein